MQNSTASRPSTASATASASRRRLLRPLSRIWIRLLAFNVLLVFLPASGLLYLDTYEQELLRAQENAMAQEGRLLAAALSGEDVLREESAQRILLRQKRQFTSRLRVIDPQGNVLADSARLGPRRESGEAPEEAEGLEGSEDARDSWTFRLGRNLYRLVEKLLGRGEPASSRRDVGPVELLERPEIRRGFGGEYGAASRPTPGQRSLTLSSVLPVWTGDDPSDEVAGVVLVSRSTFRILQSLDLVRVEIFRVFLASVLAAVVLSLLLATTIARPLRRLQQEAGDLLDRRGRLRGRFRGSRRLDEIGDLARALEELSRRLEDHIGFMESFASDVSHEFKNPLASIRTAAELISEADDPRDRARFTQMIQGQVARMEHLLSTAQELTRVDALLEQEERAPVTLGPLLEDIVTGYRLRLGGKGVELCLEGAGAGLEEGTEEGEEIVVDASPERLAQVVENLLDNAVSFSPEGGEVTVRLSASAERAVLEVSDQGPGIPPEHLERIFQRFFSYRPEKGSEQKKGAGHTGLGLSVVRAIVEGYGGRVSAQNVAVDASGASGSEEGASGARFRVELPRRLAD